jgi:hypothetical protein
LLEAGAGQSGGRLERPERERGDEPERLGRAPEAARDLPAPEREPVSPQQ